MRLIITLILLSYSICIHGQNKHVTSADSIAISKQQISQTLAMLKNLSTKGIDMSKDSLIVSEEFNRLLKDEVYNKTIYPDIYTWEQTINYIKTQELKKAFWYLINLYPTSDKNKELVIKSVITYDALVKMDKVLINTFYTYAFTDPESSIIVDNTPEITRPDILESKLRTVNELVQYIHKYREQIKNSK
ncbi:MAG: hypothetical protein KAQ75_03795 [Bacteroidales bacterium]|nr:hypothetical protein [Bacteroidales bacterium]